MKTEWKTKVAAITTWATVAILLEILAASGTDYIKALPDAVEAPAYALLPALLTWLASYKAKHRPGEMSPSAVDAVRSGNPRHSL